MGGSTVRWRRQPRAEIDDPVLDPSYLPLQRFAPVQILVGLFGRGCEFAVELRQQGGEFAQFLRPGFSLVRRTGHDVYAAASHIRLSNQTTKNSPTRPRTTTTILRASQNLLRSPGVTSSTVESRLLAHRSAALSIQTATKKRTLKEKAINPRMPSASPMGLAGAQASSAAAGLAGRA